MTKKRRMPVNVLQAGAAGQGGDPVLEGLVGGEPAPVPAARGRPGASAPAPDRSAQTREWLEARRLRRARESVNDFALGSAALGLVPWPLVAVAALVTIQVALVRRLARQYGATPRRNAAKAVVASVVVGAVLVAAAGVAAAVLRLLPVVGQVSGVVCQALAAAAATHVVGRVFIKHFEAGETLLDLDPVAMREYFRRKISGGAGPGPAAGGPAA
jgi:uncharacterized protein (DUF697 family)